MSRIWTAITINTSAGTAGKHEFAASYDYVVAAAEFRKQNPGVHLVAMMPGTRPECQTYDITDRVVGSAAVDPFSLEGLGDI